MDSSGFTVASSNASETIILGPYVEICLPADRSSNREISIESNFYQAYVIET